MTWCDTYFTTGMHDLFNKSELIPSLLCLLNFH